VGRHSGFLLTNILQTFRCATVKSYIFQKLIQFRLNSDFKNPQVKTSSNSNPSSD
jgi:hypothetical protein